jgi:photosystem II stability/assembly factor-like uncharacterized protein
MKKATWQYVISATIIGVMLLLFPKLMPVRADAANNSYWVLRQPPSEIIYSGGYPYSIPWVEVVAWGGLDNNVIYAGNTDIASDSDIPHGVYRSINNGRTWEYLGIIDEKEAIKVLKVHPTKPNIVLAGFTLTYYQAGIYLSEDSGISWTNVLPDLTIYDIEIDPINPNVMYAAGVSGAFWLVPSGVYRSVDEGRTWQFLTSEWFSDIEVHPESPNILFATRQFSTNSYEGVYRSDDSGQIWNQISEIQQTHIVINENNPDQMFIFGAHYNGIWRTDDSGQSWQNVTSNLPYVISPQTIQSATIDPNNSNTIWIGLKYDGMYVSYDGGEIWHQESDGLPFIGQGIFGPQCISSDISDGKLIIACDGRLFIQNKVTFSDVPASHWAWPHIESIYNVGITHGCSSNPLLYCPSSVVTRDQMAVFLLKGRHGASYVPPAATGVFADVPTDYWAAAWIEQLAAEGITAGCSVTPKLYCPSITVTRDQMAVFLLRAKHGYSYTPPAPSSVFFDVPIGYWSAAWIEQLAAEGITAGCGNSNYCPTNPVTRDQMAVFLQRNFNLQLP